jgi:hemolysin III
MMSTQAWLAPTPALRGYLHLAAALVAPYALLLLLSIADSPRGVVSGAIFGASLIILYSTSAIYHLVPWGRRLRAWMQRLDHSMIFIFIAGAYTPFAVKLMSDPWGIPILSVVGGLAVIGFVITVAGLEPPRWIRVGLYLGLGWVGVVAISELAAGLPWQAFALLMTSGILFSLGGVIYATRRPNPFPRVFGYHEVFHTLQVAATAAIYSVVAIYVLQS